MPVVSTKYTIEEICGITPLCTRASVLVMTNLRPPCRKPTHVLEAEMAGFGGAWNAAFDGVKQPTDLPGGWVIGRDEDGDDLFINLNEDPVLETYSDPRISLEVSVQCKPWGYSSRWISI